MLWPRVMGNMHIIPANCDTKLSQPALISPAKMHKSLRIALQLHVKDMDAFREASNVHGIIRADKLLEFADTEFVDFVRVKAILAGSVDFSEIELIEAGGLESSTGKGMQQDIDFI